MEPAYVLMPDSHAKRALVFMREKLDERVKVLVKNVSPPYDVVTVDAWWSNAEYGWRFNYMDGLSEHIVEFGPEMAAMLAADCL